MPIFNNILAGSSGQGDTGYDIDQSLRFNDDSAAYLSKTFTGTPTLSTKATISLWWKRGGIGDTGVNGGEQTLISLADAYDFSTNIPWKDLKDEIKNLFFNGSNGQKIIYSYHRRKR